jgi:hypothetical protein
MNVMIGITDYNKTSSSLLTLEALADSEEGCNENSKPLHCPDFRRNPDYNAGTNFVIRVSCCENGTDHDFCAFPSKQEMNQFLYELLHSVTNDEFYRQIFNHITL